MAGKDPGVWVFRGIATLFTLIGVVAGVRTWSWVQRSVTTTGMVVGTEIKDDPTAAQTTAANARHYPVVEFNDASGARHRFRGDVSRGEGGSDVQRRSGWRMGDTVDVRYDPRDPDHGRMAGTWTWLLPAVFIGIGALALFVSFRVAAYGG